MKTLIEQFDHELVDLAWSLWTELGVAGTHRQHANCLIALEELIILTAVIAKRDPRLRDEALDWCSRNHYFVSITRLRTLVKSYGESIYESFSIFSETLNSAVQSKWPVFVHVKPLTFKPSEKSTPPQCQAPALFGLRLRALFGVGVRADLFTFLLTQNESSFTASDAVEIGYSKRSLMDLLDHLVQSGTLLRSTARNKKKYELAKKEQLNSLVGELPKLIPPWRRILEVIFSLRIPLLQAEKNSLSTNMVVMRNSLARMEDLLCSLNLSPPPLQSNPEQYWKSFSEWLLETAKVFAQGNFGGDFKTLNPFDKIIFALMQHLYKIDDCLDGLELIISSSTQDLVKHSTVFREAYQLSFSYMYDLQAALKDMLGFPFHELHDTELADIPYQFSKDHLQPFLKFVEELPSLNQITNPRLALKEYENFQVELKKVYRLIFELKNRLKEIYFSNTDAHLLTLSEKLYKRHPVLKLFSS